MPQIRAVFCRIPHFTTPILRAATWSSWSHVAPIIDDEDDMVIDATFKHGVARRSLSQLLADASKFEIKTIECPDPKAAFDFARDQLGKPYDTWGALGVGLHRDWQADDAWFCSEFFEAMAAAGGNRRFVNNANRVTPQHSWMVR